MSSTQAINKIISDLKCKSFFSVVASYRRFFSRLVLCKETHHSDSDNMVCSKPLLWLYCALCYAEKLGMGKKISLLRIEILIDFICNSKIVSFVEEQKKIFL